MKNLKTNIIGIVLIVVGIAAIFFKDASITEALALITAGAGFLAAKDHNNHA